MKVLSIAVIIASALTLTLTVYAYCAPIFREVTRALT